MKSRSESSALPRLAFWLNLALAAVLATAVLVSPYVSLEWLQGSPAERLPAVFARDWAVRQTSLAAALALVVTAWVFFRVPGANRSPAAGRPPRLTTPTQSNVVGA